MFRSLAREAGAHLVSPGRLHHLTRNPGQPWRLIIRAPEHRVEARASWLIDATGRVQEAYRHSREQIYAQEQRFAAHPFWQRRRPALTASSRSR